MRTLGKARNINTRVIQSFIKLGYDDEFFKLRSTIIELVEKNSSLLEVPICLCSIKFVNFSTFLFNSY